MSRKLNKKGFTLIEVVLVLAIGGLIFLLAFLAFQQVQTNRRDTARRSDASRFVAEASNYAGDHNNAFPDATALAGWVSNYLNSPKDPQGTTYTFTYSNAAPGATPAVTVTAGSGTNAGANATTDCGGTAALAKTAFKVQIKLEKGTACRDSS